MQSITLRMPQAYVDAVDALVDAGVYPNRSEAIRAAVRDAHVPQRPSLKERLDTPETGESYV